MTATGANLPSETRTAGEAVRCLAIPLANGALVVPYTAVAEVTGYEAPTPVPNAPGWLLGMTRWRGRGIPLLAFEPLLGGESPQRATAPERVVVLNTLGGNPRLPFVAVAATGIPRLTLARAEDVEALDVGPDDGSAVLQRIRLAGSAFAIPDLDALEQMLLRLGI